MKIHFHLRYSSKPGETLWVCIDGEAPIALTYLNEDFWHGVIEASEKQHQPLAYHYLLTDAAGNERIEWDNDRTIDLSAFTVKKIQIMDFWNTPGTPENAFYTQPFQQIFLKRSEKVKFAKPTRYYTHVFRIKAPMLEPEEIPCLLGHGLGLRNWDLKAPILLQRDASWWTAHVDLTPDEFPIGYKYGIWNKKTHSFAGFEEGPNRSLFAHPGSDKVIVNDGFLRIPLRLWRGAGVSVPVFSLRSEGGLGVGEFADLIPFADWAASTGMRLIQLLPVNDTEATHTWTDSYPYSAISAFALHPIYLNIEKTAAAADAPLPRSLAKTRKQLNALDAIDYEAVLKYKWETVRHLFAHAKSDFRQNPDYQTFFQKNRDWLLPYAAFCVLRDLYGTADFARWKTHRICSTKVLKAVTEEHGAEMDLRFFVQWQLHSQLREAVVHAHHLGIALKGDIPIGISRHSCDAWVAPDLYNMDMQAGAPPDDFAVNGQNWGFPTYNWKRMREDGYAWWRRRFEQMSDYFDAFRIDHILGFFRIWSIPTHAVQGILGYFVPAIALSEREFHEAGAGFNRERLCRPYINDQILHDTFGDLAQEARDLYLERSPDAGRWSGGSPYALKAPYATQRQVEQYFATREDTPENKRLREGLYALIANVILIETGADAYHFRFGADQTESFRYLPDEVKPILKQLYLDYFYRRQDAMWAKEALQKLPELRRATDMLICGEDLGMVPHCVPDVMRDLGILSLEIQRMPKQSDRRFFHPKDAPYLSVVTPGTHDMSVLRGWWEEDRALSQRFFNEILGQQGQAPYFCEDWVAEMILRQHLHSPAMWCIVQLQDWMAIDASLRRENPHDERINIPANPKHYWRYRAHLSIAQLSRQKAFNARIRNMITESGRGA